MLLLCIQKCVHSQQQTKVHVTVPIEKRDGGMFTGIAIGSIIDGPFQNCYWFLFLKSCEQQLNSNEELLVFNLKFLQNVIIQQYKQKYRVVPEYLRG